MSILKSSTSLILLLVVALIGFILVKDGLFSADPPSKVTEAKIEQTAQVEQDTFNSITPQLKIWYGKINAKETKQLELNVLFPYEGKFFIEATALAYEKRPFAYDKQPKVWKTLGKYLANVTIKKGEEGKIEKARTRPKVLGQKVKAEGPVISSWYEMAKRDTLQDKSADENPTEIPIHGGPLPLHVSRQQGEAPIDLLISFEPKPKVDEPTKLLLSVLSTVPRDSVVVYLFFTGSIKVIK